MFFIATFIERHKTQKFGVEVEFDFADWPMAVLGEDKFGDVSRFVTFLVVVVVNAMEHHDKVSILLDGTGFTKVGELWAGIIAAGKTTGELSKGNDWDTHFAGESFEATRNFGNFLHAVTGIAVGTLQKLQIVNDDHADIFVMGGAADFVSEFEDGHGAGVVDIEWDFAHLGHGVTNAGEIFVAEVAGADFPVVDAGDVRNNTIDNFLGGHLH